MIIRLGLNFAAHLAAGIAVGALVVVAAAAVKQRAEQGEGAGRMPPAGDGSLPA